MNRYRGIVYSLVHPDERFVLEVLVPSSVYAGITPRDKVKGMSFLKFLKNN